MSDPWNGSTKGSHRLFKPTRSLEIPRIEYFHDLYTCYFYFRVNSTNRCYVHASKDKQGHLVKWVKKSSFSCLNKLFKIDQIEWNHNVLLIEKNLRAVLTQAKPFVIPLLPWLAPSTLVLSEHFVLKDLPFYKVTHLADTKARQAHLNAQEKKL